MVEKTKVLCTLVVVAMLYMMAAVTPAWALTYTYTGNNYTRVDDGSLGANMTATVTFSPTITAGFTGELSSTTYLESTDILSWRMDSGSWSIDNNNFHEFYLNFIFNNGEITYWSFEAYRETDRFIVMWTNHIESAPLWNHNHAMTASLMNPNNDQKNGYSGFSWPSTPGSWAIQNSPVPEPATMLLFGTGIAGLAAVGRRKRS